MHSSRLLRRRVKTANRKKSASSARSVCEGWPVVLIMCGIQTAQPVLLEGDCFNNKTGVKTTSWKAKVGAGITVPGRPAQLGFGTDLSSAVRRQVSKDEPGFLYGLAGRAQPFCWRRSAFGGTGETAASRLSNYNTPVSHWHSPTVVRPELVSMLAPLNWLFLKSENTFSLFIDVNVTCLKKTPVALYLWFYFLWFFNAKHTQRTRPLCITWTH